MSTAIAVIVPTRNRAHLLSRCLDSLEKQTLPRERFVVFAVDDGSTDNTLEVLRERGIPHKTILNSGPATARNKGVRATDSEFLAFIDDDAIAEPDWLLSAYSAFSRGRFRDAAEGEVLRQGEDLPLSHSVHHIGPGGFLTCNLIIRRHSFERLGGFDERFKYPMNEDFDFFLRLRKAGMGLEYLPELRVHHPVEQLRFWPLVRDAGGFARRRVEADALLFHLHPQEYAKVKADASAMETLKRLSVRYAYAEAIRPVKRFLRHPWLGVLWLNVCLLRQAVFLRLRLKGAAA